MDILKNILKNKYLEVQKHKKLYPISELEKSKFFSKKCFSISENINKKKGFGIIAEFKRQSPSLGIINKKFDIKKISIEYENAGVSGISVLTDEKYFSSNFNDLLIVRNNTSVPIIKKDFIIDEYQIFSAKSMGADAILLISEILSKKEIERFTYISQNIGMEVIMEIHNEDSIKKINDNINIIGINNRDLKTFKVNKEHSSIIYPKIPKNFLKISESGLYEANDIIHLKNIGFNGFLIGEMFIKNSNPGNICKKLIKLLS